MNIKELVLDAINDLSVYNLPSSGLLAGGSLANTIWSKVSGNKAVIDDIDIFNIVNVEKPNTVSKYDYVKVDVKYDESYDFIESKTSVKEFYNVKSSERDGILNLVECESSSNDYNIIINSFDLNCVQVGYDLETGNVYYTDDFLDFLNTGIIKIVNINTPSHTLVRLAKKKVDLCAKYDLESEFEIIRLGLGYYSSLNDVVKLRFQEKYHNNFLKYSDQYSDHFVAKRDHSMEEYLRLNFNIDKVLWVVTPKDEIVSFNKSWIRSTTDVINSCRLKNNDLWNKIGYLISDIKNVDIIPSNEDTNLLNRTTMIAPGLINKLKFLKLSEQLDIVKKFTNKFGLLDGPLIMNNFDFDIDLEDELNSLFCGLSVRKVYKSYSKITRLRSMGYMNDDGIGVRLKTNPF